MRRSFSLQQVRGSLRQRRKQVWWPVVLMCMMSGPSALAEESPSLLEDTFVATLGAFFLESETTLRLDGEGGEVGTDFDWEENFGGSNGNRFRVDGAWRFADRHKVRGMWFNFSRKRSAVFDEEVAWGDATFPVGATVDGIIEFDIYELAYEYAFVRREDLELSGSFGLHFSEFRAAMSAELDSGGAGGTVEIRDEGKLNVPLPVLGGRAIWRIGGDFWLDAMVQLFALEYENVEGRLIDTRLGVLWQPRDWGGLGIGYNRFDIDVDVNRSRYAGKLEWVYQGPQIFYSVSF